MNKAQQARENAYAPYSRFRVGTALQLASGEIVLGSNQENAAYPSGLCAERVAVFSAGANFPNQTITSLAITVRSENHEISEAIAPCGACRQSLAEYEQKQKAPSQSTLWAKQVKSLKWLRSWICCHWVLMPSIFK